MAAGALRRGSPRWHGSRRMLMPVVVALVLACPGRCGESASGAEDLTGTAEDLWGDTLELGRLPGLVLIEPFSPSNCGYCMMDGEFILANYFAPNAATGGSNLYQCLFNPQRDVLTYLKHVRAEHVPVLTFPPTLHRHHRDGFPFMIAFRDGQPVYQGPTHPYEERARKLGALFWPDRNAGVILTSPSHLAPRFLFENESAVAVFVVPDGDEDGLLRWQQRKAEWRGNPGDPRYEGDLTQEDLRKNLVFMGPIDRFRFDALQDPASPIQIDPVMIRIGPHSFSRSQVAVRAAYPNPNNRERYVMLSLQNPPGVDAPPNNWADYAVYPASPLPVGNQTAQAASGGSSALPAAGGSTPASMPSSRPPAPLLEGLLRKLPGNRWLFVDSLSIGPAADQARCAGSICRAPAAWNPDAFGGAPAPPALPKEARTPHGVLWTLGSAGARFPALASGPEGACWTVWSERGNILAALLGRVSDAPPIHAVENDHSDSYDPVAVAAGNDLWVFYLNDRDGFYRLRGRSLRGGRWSPDQLLSEPGIVDAVTPAAAAGSDSRVLVAWSEWRANQRFLEYRILTPDVLGPVRVASIAPSVLGDYTNAWDPSLAYGENGEPWGAWNQHYPALLSVCAGNLVDPALPVTRVTPNDVDSENGGYPAVVADAAGNRWVIWESFGWDVLSGKAQAILAARFDVGACVWGLGQALSSGEQTYFNQTPCAALDERGVLWVAWSGRGKSGDTPWGIYLTRLERGGWSAPERISPEETSARAPSICASGSRVWIGWHAGVGEAMKVQVLDLRRAH